MTLSRLSSQDEIELTVVMPCLNEAVTLPTCIGEALAALTAQGIRGEVIVADNGSTDDSVAVATHYGARVIHVTERGYGAALRGGITAARGRFVLMGDADASYDFGEMGRFLAPLRDGAELVMGNRFAGGIQRGAMPFLHRYLGNPVLSFVGRVFFKTACRDFHCGLRAFSRQAIASLHLVSSGMEFASELVVKASMQGWVIREVPVTLRPDGRGRPPHLRTWRDGWRHLRFMLLFSPRWLFLYPGLTMLCIGTALLLWIWPAPRHVFGVTLDVHTMLYGGAMVQVGFQAVWFAACSHAYAVAQGLAPTPSPDRDLFRFVNLETGLIVGVALLAVGLWLTALSVRGWWAQGLMAYDPREAMRLVIPAVVALSLGTQTVLASFFMSVLVIRRA